MRTLIFVVANVRTKLSFNFRTAQNSDIEPMCQTNLIFGDALLIRKIQKFPPSENNPLYGNFPCGYHYQSRTHAITEYSAHCSATHTILKYASRAQ